MGHFGRRPIRRAWFLVVFPALTLNYMGQGSLILGHPAAISNPFYLLMPEWSRVPMIVLATVATLIASQAVISGAFSVTRQAIQLGFLPRLSIRHTSGEAIGQVYVPAVNWALFAAVVALVHRLRLVGTLATAYGIAVTGTLLIDSMLFLVVVRVLWRKPLWMVAAGMIGFVTVDLLFLAANVTKIFHGGWFPLLVGAVVLVILTTWDRGRADVTAAREDAEGPLGTSSSACTESRRPRPGCPAWDLPEPQRADHPARPAGRRRQHPRRSPRRSSSSPSTTTNVPHVPPSRAGDFDDLDYPEDGYSHVTLRFGYLDDPAVTSALVQASKTPGLGVNFNPYHATYFLSQITIVPIRGRGMARWRKNLFVAMARNAASPVEYFKLPPERVVTLGSRLRF